MQSEYIYQLHKSSDEHLQHASWDTYIGLHTYLIYTGQILTKRYKRLYRNYCQMQEEIYMYKKYKNKEKIKCY